MDGCTFTCRFARCSLGRRASSVCGCGWRSTRTVRFDWHHLWAAWTQPPVHHAAGYVPARLPTHLPPGYEWEVGFPYPCECQRQAARLQFTNGLDTKTQGVDLTANWRVPEVGGGALDWTAAVNWTKNEITKVNPLPPIFQGTGESGLIDSVTYIGITQERPDWRGTLTAQYSLSRFQFGQYSLKKTVTWYLMASGRWCSTP